MQFPEITTSEVFAKIPYESIEKVSENAWNEALLSLGNCRIDSQKKLGSGRFDALVRYYDERGDNYVWILVEYKRDGKANSDIKAICQLLMYLGNFFYDVSLEGTDNFAGIIVASSDYFYFIPRKNILGIMEKFEYIWRKHFRVRPCDAHKEYEIYDFVRESWSDIIRDSVRVQRYDKNIRLDELIKSIYKEWNLQ